MSDSSWYVRHRGKVRGPYTRDELETMVKRNQVSMLHQVSEDRVSWVAARKEFGKPAAPQVAAAVSHANSGKDSLPPVEPLLDDGVFELTGDTSDEAIPNVAPPSPAPGTQAGEAELDSAVWYYVAANNKEYGPVPGAKISSLLREKKLNADSLVWSQNMVDWKPLSTTPLSSLLEQVKEPPRVRNSVPIPSRMTPTRKAHARDDSIVYAGFWLRFVAALLDELILFVIIFVVFLTMGLRSEGSLQEMSEADFEILVLFVRAVAFWLYHACMESSGLQATLGKRALGLQVTDLVGERISFGKATGRHLGKYISMLLLLIGYLMAAWTARKQALHDMMAGCLVIQK